MMPERTLPHPPLDGLDPTLRDAYLAGVCTPDELRQIDAWIAGYPVRKSALEGLRCGLAKPVTYPTFAPASELAARVQRTVIPSQRAVPRTRPWMQWPVTVVAGIVCGVVALFAIARTYIPASPGHGTSTYTTARGEQTTITLPDGSTVVLNVASRLDVPADYAEGNRNVRLVGEAMFMAAHHNSNPLTVTTRSATARVLGTQFLVREYDTDTTAIVAVRYGRVAVDTMVVTASQLAEIERSGQARVRPTTDGQFAFASGVLDLHNVPLSVAVAELNRWYDVDIRLGDSSLATRRLRGQLEPGTTDDLVQVLEVILAVRVVRDGRMLTLYPRQVQ